MNTEAGDTFTGEVKKSPSVTPISIVNLILGIVNIVAVVGVLIVALVAVGDNKTALQSNIDAVEKKFDDFKTAYDTQAKLVAPVLAQVPTNTGAIAANKVTIAANNKVALANKVVADANKVVVDKVKPKADNLLDKATMLKNFEVPLAGWGALKTADWTHSFDKNGVWSACETGYALIGLQRSGKVDDKTTLAHLEKGFCAKGSASGSNKNIDFNADCYEATNPGTELDKNASGSSCKAGWALTGFFRGQGDKLSHIEKFRCCRPDPAHRNTLLSDGDSFYGSDDNHQKGSLRKTQFVACFDKAADCYAEEGWFLTGIYKGEGDELKHIENIYTGRFAYGKWWLGGK